MTADLIIFDCDGVLIDSERIACRVDAECLRELGLPIDMKDIMDRYVGVSAAAMFADIEKRFGRQLPPDVASTVQNRLMRAFEGELAPMPGARALLRRIKVPVCVASSSSLERVRRTLALVGLTDYFEPHIFSATQVREGKPAPDLFLFAAERMNAAPARCIVIEDSIAGVQAGVAAGMCVVGFTGGSHCSSDHADRLRLAGAQAILTRLSDFSLEALGGAKIAAPT